MTQELSWPLILGLASTGIVMALASSLIGMRARVEMPAWWCLYAGWVAVVLLTAYIKNNPWYAEQMNKPHAKLRLQFMISGLIIGTGFGAIVAGIAWAIDRL